MQVSKLVRGQGSLTSKDGTVTVKPAGEALAPSDRCSPSGDDYSPPRRDAVGLGPGSAPKGLMSYELQILFS
jgi:hypothetical protein